MKKTAIMALCATTLVLAANAAPFMAVGDGAELFVTADVKVDNDSNIYLDSTNEKNDTILSFKPGVDLVFGNGTATKGNAYYREEIRRFSRNDIQNDSLSSLGFNSSTDTGASKYDLNASYAQMASNDNDINAIGGLVRREVVNIGGKAEIDLTGKTKLGIAPTFGTTDYSPASYTDSTIWTIPVDVYYNATAKMDWSLGYRFRDTEQDGAALDFEDHFLNVGARGEFTPKLSGQVRVGYNLRNFSSGKDDNGLGLEADLNYAMTQKTSWNLRASNDYGNSGTGEDTKIAKVGASVNSKLTTQWTVSASLDYSTTEYPARTDDYIDSLVSVTYTYNEIVNFAASLAYRDNSSDSAAAEFSGTVVSFGANIRY